MNILGLSFTPKIWTVAVMLVFVIGFIQLGQWQLSRAAEKDQRQHQLNQLASQPPVMIPTSLVTLEDFLYRQVEVRGTYLPEKTIYLDNKVHQGVAGYHLITPLQLSHSEMVVLINRGWIAAGPNRSVLPAIPVADGEVIVTGLVVPPTQRTLELSGQAIAGYVWGVLYIDRYREMTGLMVQPILVQQQDVLKDGLVRQWVALDSGSDRNLGYAMQWYSFAALALIIFLVLNVKRNKTKQA